MLQKIAASLIGLTLVTFMSARSDAAKADKAWVQACFLIATSYFLITSSLYLISYPLSELLSATPSYMAFTLLRVLAAFLCLASIHLYNGLILEVNLQNGVVEDT